MPDIPNHTNEQNLELLRRISTGDEQALRQVFNDFSPKLTQFAWSLVKVKEVAAEIVDDVFIWIWKHKDHLDAILNMEVYLYRSVKNSCLNYLSSKAHKQITEPFDFIDIVLSKDQTPEEKMISSELRNKITSAIEELPPRCKMIFKLVREDGLSYKSVAKILNLAVGTVDAQMVIAVKRISERVHAHFTSFPKKNLKNS